MMPEQRELDHQGTSRQKGGSQEIELDSQAASTCSQEGSSQDTSNKQGQDMEPDSKMTNDPNIHTLELQDDIGDVTLNEAKATIEKLLKGTMAVEDAINQDTFTVINKSMETCKQRLGENKTPALWIQYMKLVDILRRSIKTERTGDFSLLIQLDK